MSKAKATHQGTCQACGALQKLPNGRLSTHGYTKRWGFFQGICQGTNELPFELSKDLIESCIVRANKQIADTEAEIARLLAPTEGPTAYVQTYFNGIHSWTTETIQKDGTRFFFERNRDGKREYPLNYSGEYPKTVAEFCTLSNARRAKDHQNIVRELRGYVSWQQKRIQDWKPSPEALKALKSDVRKDGQVEVGDKVTIWDRPALHEGQPTVKKVNEDGTILARSKRRYAPNGYSFHFVNVCAKWNGEKWVYTVEA